MTCFGYHSSIVICLVCEVRFVHAFVRKQRGMGRPKCGSLSWQGILNWPRQTALVTPDEVTMGPGHWGHNLSSAQTSGLSGHVLQNCRHCLRTDSSS